MELDVLFEDLPKIISSLDSGTQRILDGEQSLNFITPMPIGGILEDRPC